MVFVYWRERDKKGLSWGPWVLLSRKPTCIGDCVCVNIYLFIQQVLSETFSIRQALEWSGHSSCCQYSHFKKEMTHIQATTVMRASWLSQKLNPGPPFYSPTSPLDVRSSVCMSLIVLCVCGHVWCVLMDLCIMGYMHTHLWILCAYSHECSCMCMHPYL